MEKTNNVFCKKWGQFGGTTCQTVLQLSVSQSVTSFPPLPVMTGLHILSQLHVSLISGKGSAMGIHTSAQLSTDREQWGHMGSLSHLGSWQWLTTLEWHHSHRASKGNHLTWKVIINGGQSFSKEMISYRGQSQTESECTAQQIVLFLQPVSTLFKPHTCC